MNYSKESLWSLAIGLQDVDGLKVSNYLINITKEHINGNININDAKRLIDNYHKDNINKDTLEADKVSVKITELLSEDSFNFNVLELTNTHLRLFKDIYKEAGKFRNYNFIKKEWVLNEDTVTYSPYELIKDTLEYDFNEEKKFSYKGLSLDEFIRHIAKFTSNIWQIHPFCEGNTRTTAVFIIKYLRTFGFNINNDVFANNSWYFRNSLARANYKNFNKNIYEDTPYLEKFFYNLLSNTNYELKNKYIHIDYKDLSNNKSYSLEEKAIINIIKNNSSIKQEDIAKALNKSIRTIKTIMKNMQDKGIIKRIGKKNSKWSVL